MWIGDYPRDDYPRFSLSHIYENMGQYDKALVERQACIRIAPDHVLAYSFLGVAYIFLNRLDEANATFDQALARKMDSGSLRQQMYILAFLKGDDAQMGQQVAWALGKPGVEDILLSEQSDTEAYYGRMSRARDFSRRAVGTTDPQLQIYNYVY